MDHQSCNRCGGGLGTPAVRIANALTHDPVDPVEGGDMEVRPPTGMNSLARDARA